MAEDIEQMRDTITFLEGVIQSSRAFAYRCDNEEDVNMLHLTGCVRSITGCDPEELLFSKGRTYASLCHPDDLDVMIAKVDAAIAKKQPWDVDYRICRPDHTIILVRERGEAVFDHNGDITHLQGLVTDAQDEHNLRNQMIKSQQLQKRTNDEISKLAQNIANSVRDLSILSINARIEAAHAGKAGRGFSVVASEMSDLAELNAKWAKDISQRML